MQQLVHRQGNVYRAPCQGNLYCALCHCHLASMGLYFYFHVKVVLITSSTSHYFLKQLET